MVRYLNRYEGYDDYLADALSSSDEGITSEIHNALHQLVLNQTVTALKKGVRGMIEYSYRETQIE